MAVRLRVAFRTSARAVRRSMECFSLDLAVSPIRPSSAARFASLRPRRDGVRRGLQAPVVGGSPGSGNALLAGIGPARWGRRSSYGNGFGNFSRYVTEPRDLPSESSRPTPDIRLSALIRAIVSPWKGVSEPPSSATVKYRSFSSIPLPCPEEQGDAGGRRRAIAGLHGAVVHGMRGDPLRTRGTADRRPCRARFAGRAPRACRRAGRTPRSSGRHVPDLRKADPINNRRFPNS